MPGSSQRVAIPQIKVSYYFLWVIWTLHSKRCPVLRIQVLKPFVYLGSGFITSVISGLIITIILFTFTKCQMSSICLISISGNEKPLPLSDWPDEISWRHSSVLIKIIDIVTQCNYFPENSWRVHTMLGKNPGQFRKNVYSRLRSSLKKETDRQRKWGWKIDGKKEERKEEDFLIIKREF